MTNSFIFIVKKVENTISFVLGLKLAAQDGGASESNQCTINVQSMFKRVFFKRIGLTMANINLPQGE